MADRWCRPLSTWRQMFRSWIEEPEPEALLGAANFFDFRAIAGRLSLDPLESVIGNAAGNRIFLAHLARAGLRFTPPLGLFRTLKDEDGGIDLKRGGIILEAGSSVRSTVDRLTAAGDAGALSRDGAAELAEAFRTLHRLRLEHQLRCHRGGRAISNAVPLDELTPGERRHLKEIFGLIRSVQEATARRFDVHQLG